MGFLRFKNLKYLVFKTQFDSPASHGVRSHDTRIHWTRFVHGLGHGWKKTRFLKNILGF